MASDLGIVLQLPGNVIIGMMLILLMLIMAVAVNIINTRVEVQTSNYYHVVKIPDVMLFPGWLVLAVMAMLLLLVHLGDRDLAMKL